MKIKDIHGNVLAEFPDSCMVFFGLPSGSVHVLISNSGDKLLASADDGSTLTASAGERVQAIYLKPSRNTVVEYVRMRCSACTVVQYAPLIENPKCAHCGASL